MLILHPSTFILSFGAAEAFAKFHSDTQLIRREGDMRNAIVACLCAVISHAANAACSKSIITTPSPFMGNGDGEVFQLSDGSLWKDISYKYLYLYEYFPQVIICPSEGKMYLKGHEFTVIQISGRTTGSAPPQNASSSGVIRSQINGTFEGWTGETIFELLNGQIWKQSSYAYTYSYAFMPSVMIYKDGGVYKMRVDGVDGEIAVRRIH